MGLIIASNLIYDKYLKSPITDDLIAETAQEDNEPDPDCSLVGINMHGGLLTYVPEGDTDNPLADSDVVASEAVVAMIEGADKDDKVKAILIEADSGGGSPVAGEEIAKALKRVTKPTAAVIRQNGLSAAYWAVTGADRIFASANSDVGSIGVTSSYLDNLGKNKKEGLNYVQLSVGKFKDAGNPDKPLTAEERALWLRDLKMVYRNFVNAVAANRQLAVAKVEKLADGRSVLGEEARSLGLVDAIGGVAEATKYLEGQTGVTLNACWY